MLPIAGVRSYILLISSVSLIEKFNNVPDTATSVEASVKARFPIQALSSVKQAPTLIAVKLTHVGKSADAANTGLGLITAKKVDTSTSVMRIVDNSFFILVNYFTLL